MSDDTPSLGELLGMDDDAELTSLREQCEAKDAEIERLKTERDASQGTADDIYAKLMNDRERIASLSAENERLRKALSELRDAVFELCEDTEDKCAAEAARDTEGKAGAYARGRIHEAKGIRRTIGEIARELIARAALDAAAAVDGDAGWNAACEAVALALEARAAKVYDHAKGPYLKSAADARSLKRLK